MPATVTASYRCWSLGASTSFVSILSQLRPLLWIPPLNLPQANCPEFFQGDAFSCLQCGSHRKCLTSWWSPLTTTELIQSKASSNFPGASYQLKSIPGQWVRPALNRCPPCWGTSWLLWLPGSNRGRWDLFLKGTFSIFQTKKSMEWILLDTGSYSVYPSVGIRLSFVAEEAEAQRLPLTCFPKAMQLLLFYQKLPFTEDWLLRICRVTCITVNVSAILWERCS